MNEDIKLSKYILRLGISYFTVSAILIIFNNMFKDYAIHGIYIIAMFISIIITVNYFLKVNNRVPSKRERRKLAAFSLIAFFMMLIPMTYFSNNFENIAVNINRIYSMFDNDWIAPTGIIAAGLIFNLFILYIVVLITYFLTSKIIMKIR